MTASRFPWARLMAVGLGQLRLRPCDFWAMTPREFLACLPEGADRAGAMTRADLNALMTRLQEHDTA